MSPKSVATRSAGGNRPRPTRGSGSRSATAAAGRRHLPRPVRRAKIVATIGPTSSAPKQLRRLVAGGMDVARLNMSHGTHASHAAVIASLRDQERPIGVLLDLSGPKLRTGLNQGRQPVRLEPDGRVWLAPGRGLTTADRVSVSYAGLARDLAPGKRVLLDDGQLELEVIGVRGKEVLCRVVVGGELGEHKGIHLPGAWVSAPALTAKDRLDLRFGFEQKVDLIALSFVRGPREVLALKRAMRQHGRLAPIIAKLETLQAMAELDEILEVAAGVMVARGDLGLELPPDEVPLAQKRIIQRANACGKPVITATQMLESMTRSPRPTRAEATDVANAVIDGTDAVMLSGETANGRYPVRAVEMMASIIESTEQSEFPALQADHRLPDHPAGHDSDAAAVSVAAATLARQTGADALAVYTLSGITALLVARQRPPVPIFVLTPSAQVQHQLSVVWGVTSLVIPQTPDTDQMIAAGEATLRAAGLLKRGQCVVTVAGTTGFRGGTNVLQIMRS